MPINPTKNSGQIQTGQTTPADGTTPASGAAGTPQPTGTDLNGAAAATYSSGSPVFMEQPKLDQATMMLMMTKLQSKLADQQVTLANEDIKGTRKDMKDLHEKRIAKMQEYWDKMAKSQKGGFFGRLFRAISCLFKGDFKGMLENLEKAFTEDIVASIISIAILVFVAPTCPFLALALLTPNIMGDSMLMGDFADAVGLEGKAKEDFIQATHWIGFSVEVIIDIAIAVAISVATGGTATPLMVGLLVAKASVIAARETERGVKSYQATKANAEGVEAYADADRLQAQANVRQTEINKMMERIKDNYDSFANVISDSAKMLTQDYRARQAAANSV